ncbi:MAG: energy transducer TonB [Rhodoferax sp.]|nr:energy transducer TonB [Rhodoferax sp.]
MTATTHRAEFAPPPPSPGLLRALVLALLAHGLLVLVLVISAGMQSKRATVQQVVQAELWSTLPVQAAPAPQPEPVPPVQPARVAEPPPVPAPNKADIAIAKEKDKALKEKQLAPEKKPQPDQDKLEQQAEAAARSEQIKRMAQLAGNSGGGTAAQSSGPSAAYAGRIVARIRPNISYPDNIDGNPRVEVEIVTAPSGTILETRITKSSGVKSWDEAVIRAIAKTEVLPKDMDGSVPPSLLVGFRPKD